MAALTLTSKTITFPDGSTAPCLFATDGSNFYPISVLVDNAGNVVPDSTTGLPVSPANVDAGLRAILNALNLSLIHI